MKRRRKRRDSFATVSLFPFLAVLICTLGVLIILLVVAVKQADVEAREIRDAKDEASASQIAKLELDLSTQQVIVDGLEELRPELVEKMAGLRDRRGHFEDEIRRLDDEAAELARQLVELESKTALPFPSALAASEIAELEEAVAQTRKLVEERRESFKAHQPVVYSIVPHAGESGTSRRPIYIECTRDGVVFQPYGVRLSRDDFTVPLLPGNPLDAALLAIREYWIEYDLIGDEGAPYPLIVIRPSGAQNYVLARKAMTSWDSEYGYEVVEADKVLDFGESDELLKEVIEQAIADAAAQQIQIATARDQLKRLQGRISDGPDQVRGLVASGANGGFVSQGGGSNGMQQASFQNDTVKGGESNQASASFPKFDSILDQYRGDGTQSPNENLRKRGQSFGSKAGTQNTENGTSSKSTTASNGNASGESPSQESGQISIQSSRSTATSIANDRGENWALPTQTPGATGFLRPIRIHCGPEAVHIYKSRTERTSVPYNGETENAVPILVDHVWQLIDSWGEAGPNGYWRPELRFSVAKSAVSRFEDLKILLDRSGLELQESQQ